MKAIITTAILSLSVLVAYAEEQSDYSLAMRHTAFVFVCDVKAEGTGGQTPEGYYKSYLVSYPESLLVGLVGIVLPGEIWIYYDSTEYPDVPKGENAMAYHNGDKFIAFLDYKNGFHVVRTDKIESKDDIRKEIKIHTEQGGAPYVAQSAPSGDR